MAAKTPLKPPRCSSDQHLLSPGAASPRHEPAAVPAAERDTASRPHAGCRCRGRGAGRPLPRWDAARFGVAGTAVEGGREGGPGELTGEYWRVPAALAAWPPAPIPSHQATGSSSPQDCSASRRRRSHMATGGCRRTARAWPGPAPVGAATGGGWRGHGMVWASVGPHWASLQPLEPIFSQLMPGFGHFKPMCGH